MKSTQRRVLVVLSPRKGASVAGRISKAAASFGISKCEMLWLLSASGSGRATAKCFMLIE